MYRRKMTPRFVVQTLAAAAALLLTQDAAPGQCAQEDPTASDCNANGRADDCDIFLRASDDCNDNGIPDECEIAAGRLFSTDVPGLNGAYGEGVNGFGTVIHWSDYSFGRSFVILRNAWLRLDVSFGGVESCDGCLDGVCGPSGCHSAAGRAICVPLATTTGTSDGNGTVRLIAYPPCCDLISAASNAQLWFDAVPLPAPTSLSSFAEFQACFSGMDSEMRSVCDPLDYDRDGDVDLDDYNIFGAAFVGPN